MKGLSGEEREGIVVQLRGWVRGLGEVRGEYEEGLRVFGEV